MEDKDAQHILPTPSKVPVVSLSEKLYPNCLVLVGSRIVFELDFTIELKQIETLGRLT